MVEYGILGLLLSWALLNSGMKRGLVFIVFLIGLFYGVIAIRNLPFTNDQ